ncbi:hypothetical protein DL767_002183 [Monosporascus sp. MG133]|nr:hypothetical protein DL767_002183 [Monosporascus sp. MG133]
MLRGQAPRIISLKPKVPDMARRHNSIRAPLHAMATPTANMLHHDRRQRTAQRPRRIRLLLYEAVGRHLRSPVATEKGQQFVGHSLVGEHEPLAAACVLGHQVHAGRLRQDAVPPAAKKRRARRGIKTSVVERNTEQVRYRRAAGMYRRVRSRMPQDAGDDGEGRAQSNLDLVWMPFLVGMGKQHNEAETRSLLCAQAVLEGAQC